MAKSLSAQLASYAHGKVPRALRRQQVLEEAYRLFVERGFQSASMDELARRVGVSKPVIYDLAGSKEQLFRDVMASIQAELATTIASAVAAERDLAGRLHAGILAFLRFVERRRDGWCALLSMESGGGAEITAALRREQTARVADLIGGAEGDREVLAQAINGAVELVALWWQAHPDRSAESLATLLTELLAPGLVALAGRPKKRKGQ